MCRILDLNVDYDQFRTIWSSIFTDILIPESMLEGLGRRYRLVLVSNTNALHFEMIRETYGHLLRHFDDLVLSYEVRAMKPQPEIFQAAVEVAGCLPEECFYTDDIAAYVEGAKRMGIDAVTFESRAAVGGRAARPRESSGNKKDRAFRRRNARSSRLPATRRKQLAGGGTRYANRPP